MTVEGIVFAFVIWCVYISAILYCENASTTTEKTGPQNEGPNRKNLQTQKKS